MTSFLTILQRQFFPPRPPKGATYGPFLGIPCTCGVHCDEGEPKWHWDDCAKTGPAEQYQPLTIIFEDGTTEELPQALFFNLPNPTLLPWFYLVIKGRNNFCDDERFKGPFSVVQGDKTFVNCLWTEREYYLTMDFFMIKGQYS